MSHRKNGPTDSYFKRKRIGDNEPNSAMVIQSTCVHCGEVFEGDVTQGLKEKEIQHTINCAKGKAARTTIHIV
ncbi:MAG: hypothetical protein JWO13_3182 [Acidobacteriales bacterium]|nr:hypothetical protein [Terriglobales bacterium]